MLTSIITPLFNHLADLTIPFIEQVVKTKGDWELILVDNASTDETWKYIKKRAKRDKRIKVVHNDTNTGFGGGNNTGYRHAVGGQICFISNDVVIHDFLWLEKFVEALEIDPKSLIGPQLIASNDLTRYKNLNTPYLTGHCIFGSKELFDQISPIGEVWDESFGVAYFEDVWLSVQARDLGYQLKEVPSALVHLGSKSSDHFNIREQTDKTRIIFHNKMTMREIKQRKTKRIVFFVAGTPYEFNDDDFEGKGVGGAEASLIMLSRTLAGLGYMVEVYNKNSITGKFNGVDYKHINEFTYTDYCDAFILFRSFHPVIEVVNASKKYFWSCDQMTDFEGVWDHCVFPHIDRVIAISDYHKKYLKSHYVCHKPIKVIDLGIKGEDYLKIGDKVKDRAIYCSVPLRGLETLARMVPRIKAQVPDFNLVITSDYRLWGLDTPDNYLFKQMFENLGYVKFVGKVSRDELVRYQKNSQVMTYPSNYDECFCISAMECMAAGATPITFDRGALKTTVGKGGIVLSNTTDEDKYVNSVVDLLTHPRKLVRYRKAGYQIAKRHYWSTIVNQWIDLFKETSMAHTINSLSKELNITTASIKRALAIPYVSPNTKEVGDDEILKVKLAIQNKSDFIKSLDIEKFTRVANKWQKENPGKTRGELKLPIVGMPEATMIGTKVPVSVAINGQAFVSTPSKSGEYHQTKVPYDYLPSVVQLIKDYFGDVIL